MLLVALTLIERKLVMQNTDDSQFGLTQKIFPQYCKILKVICAVAELNTGPNGLSNPYETIIM